MKWIGRLTDLFKLEEIQEIETQKILSAFEDMVVRKLWLQMVFKQIRDINAEIDLRLRVGNTDFKDLAFKRQALQGVLEAVMDAKRQAKGYNPLKEGAFDLESVAVQQV